MSEGNRLVCPASQVVQSGWLPGHLLGRSIWTRADYEDNDLLRLQRQGAYVRRGVRYMRWFREDTGSSGTVSSRGDGRETGEGVGAICARGCEGVFPAGDLWVSWAHRSAPLQNRPRGVQRRGVPLRTFPSPKIGGSRGLTS